MSVRTKLFGIHLEFIHICIARVRIANRTAASRPAGFWCSGLHPGGATIVGGAAVVAIGVAAGEQTDAGGVRLEFCEDH